MKRQRPPDRDATFDTLVRGLNWRVCTTRVPCPGNRPTRARRIDPINEEQGAEQARTR
jgi:hypothetical protein